MHNQAREVAYNEKSTLEFGSNCSVLWGDSRWVDLRPGWDLWNVWAYGGGSQFSRLYYPGGIFSGKCCQRNSDEDGLLYDELAMPSTPRKSAIVSSLEFGRGTGWPRGWNIFITMFGNYGTVE